MSAVVIVGAGLSGLAAACHLTGAGHQVTVVERDPGPGGRAGVLHSGGFSFDTGPSVLTMPGLIGDALGAVGVMMPDVLPVRRLDPAYRATFADGSTIRLRAGVEVMRQEIADTCGSAEAAAFTEFVVWLRKLFEAEFPHFIDRNFDSPFGLLSSPAALARLIGLGGFRRLGPVIRRRFTDPRLQRLFTFQALYAGLSPESALALYAVITYMDSVEGVWYPDGGIHAVPTALAAAAEKAGAQLRLSESVTQVLRRRDNGGVAGVRLAGGEQIKADALVCTADLPTAYATLFPDLPAPRSVRRAEYSPSAVVWHVGAAGLPEQDVAHHNIHFGDAWSGAFDALLHRRQLMPDPSRLVTAPSVDDPTVAPAGSTAMFVLEPVPNLRSDIDWRKESAPMRERLLDFLGKNGYPTDVRTELMVTPGDWLDQGLAGGTPFSLAHSFRQTGPFRPANADKRVPGLYFAGSGTVPGVGVPMVLISGKLAAARVTKFLAPGRS